jgi:hypothetical protein
MKKLFVAVVTALVFCVAPVCAQNAPELDPAAVAATKEMLAAMKYRETMAASFKVMAQSMPANMRSMMTNLLNNDPKMDAAAKQKALAQIDKMVPAAVAAISDMMADPALIDELLAEMVPLYARTYSAAEIGQIAAFYQSPVGQKMLVSMPKLMSDSIQISQKLMGPRIGKLIQQAVQNAAKP